MSTGGHSSSQEEEVSGQGWGSSDSEASTSGSEVGSDSDGCGSGGGGSGWELPRRSARVEAWLDLLPLVMPRWLQYIAGTEHFYAGFNLTLRVAVPTEGTNDQVGSSLNQAACSGVDEGSTALGTPATQSTAAGAETVGTSDKSDPSFLGRRRYQGSTVCIDLPLTASLGDLLTAAASTANCAPDDITSLRACGGAPGSLPVTLLPMPSSMLPDPSRESPVSLSVQSRAAMMMAMTVPTTGATAKSVFKPG